MSALYIHIPFCKNKCFYCDFYSGGIRIADWSLYLGSVINEFKSRKSEFKDPISTVYIGGGTPSLIPAEILTDFIIRLSKISSLENVKEFTIEVNPEDVTLHKIDIWKSLGINRISLGIQSVNDSELKLIGRRHSGELALSVLKELNNNFSNVSVDIMHGLPSQTPESYINTLKQVLSLGPQHISSYALMLEQGTVMTLWEKNGKITLPPEDEWVKMGDLTNKIIRKAGYIRYEISNYAKKGFESSHNLSYWEGKPYIGLGPGAHSYDGKNIRKNNPCDIKGYQKFFSNEFNKNNEFFYKQETLSEVELREEMVMTRLRTKDGLDIKEFCSRFSETEKDILLQKARKYKKAGFLKEGNGKISFTDKGILVSDMILTDLI